NLVLSQEKLAALQARLAELSSAIAETKEGIARFSEDPDQVIESLRESYVRLMQTEAEKSNQLTKLEQEWDHQNRQSESKAKEIEKLE
ncbi:hypothetical protein ACYT6T_09930, partial [Streptococcus pyogenes]